MVAERLHPFGSKLDIYVVHNWSLLRPDSKSTILLRTGILPREIYLLRRNNNNPEASRYDVEITLKAGPKPYFAMMPPVIMVENGIERKPRK
jgi:hypothetical protein